jgi:hypothetical protein
VFDYGTLMMLTIVAIAQFKILEIVEHRSLPLIMICVASWLCCFFVFLIEMNFKATRYYNTVKRLFSDVNTYLLGSFVMLMTIYLEYMFKRL